MDLLTFVRFENASNFYFLMQINTLYMEKQEQYIKEPKGVHTRSPFLRQGLDEVYP